MHDNHIAIHGRINGLLNGIEIRILIVSTIIIDVPSGT